MVPFQTLSFKETLLNAIQSDEQDNVQTSRMLTLETTTCTTSYMNLRCHLCTLLPPGWAWLEFSIEAVGEQNRLSVNAYYQPKGLAGRIYWYIFLPFHFFIFQDLIKQIEKRG